MAAYNKFEDFAEQICKAVHNVGSDTWKVALTNSAPVSTNTILANITQIAGNNGYTTGGTATTLSNSESGGTMTVSGTQVVFTGGTATMADFRYAVLYNDTASSPADALVAWWDYAATVTLAPSETFTIKFNNASPGTIFTLA